MKAAPVLLLVATSVVGLGVIACSSQSESTDENNDSEGALSGDVGKCSDWGGVCKDPLPGHTGANCAADFGMVALQARCTVRSLTCCISIPDAGSEGGAEGGASKAVNACEAAGGECLPESYGANVADLGSRCWDLDRPQIDIACPNRMPCCLKAH